MECFRNLDELPPCGPDDEPVILTTGVFDGMHLAHQQLVRRVAEEARRRGGRSVVFTFSNHPLSVLAPAYAPPLLMEPERKAWFLERMGVDRLVLLRFDEAFAATPPDAFVHDILCERLCVDLVIVGFDFRFGSQGRGDRRLLESLAERNGFETEVLPAIQHEEWTISSTRIRELIASGHVHRAAQLLGRPFSLESPVVRGFGRGRDIGFPTANLCFRPDFVAPASGVYAVLVRLEDRIYPGMMNIGSSPTFEGTEYRPEVHLIDYEGGDFYDSRLRVYFLERIREERRFSGVDALRQRLALDMQITRGVYEAFPDPENPDRLGSH